MANVVTAAKSRARKAPVKTAAAAAAKARSVDRARTLAPDLATFLGRLEPLAR